MEAKAFRDICVVEHDLKRLRVERTDIADILQLMQVEFQHAPDMTEFYLNLV